MTKRESETAIHVENVSKRYGHIDALRDLTLTVEAGEIFGLVGANGAGKTTLIKILTGILRPDAGHVRVLGLDPRGDSHRLRAQIGYMPQESALYEDLTAVENVRFFAAGQRLQHATARADEVLAFVDLAGRRRDLAHTFSGGMKQRLSLACALVHRPRLLLLDEPSTGVDPKLRENMWAHFRKLTRNGATILMSTHQMDEVQHCDRAAIMRAGRVLACDTPRGLLARGAADVTIWRHGRSGQGGDEEAQPGGSVEAQPGSSVERHTLADYPTQLPRLLGADGVRRIEVVEPTLEQIVLDLIEEEK